MAHMVDKQTDSQTKSRTLGNRSAKHTNA